MAKIGFFFNLKSTELSRNIYFFSWFSAHKLICAQEVWTLQICGLDWVQKFMRYGNFKLDFCGLLPNFQDIYRVGHKFSDTLNELFVVNWLISNFFGENSKWEIASSSHNLKILVKSINHGLSYSLKRDQKSISKITFVPGFVLSLLIQKLDNFSQKLLFVIKICIILAWKRSFG